METIVKGFYLLVLILGNRMDLSVVSAFVQAFSGVLLPSIHLCVCGEMCYLQRVSLSFGITAPPFCAWKGAREQQLLFTSSGEEGFCESLTMPDLPTTNK